MVPRPTPIVQRFGVAKVHFTMRANEPNFLPLSKEKDIQEKNTMERTSAMSKTSPKRKVSDMEGKRDIQSTKVEPKVAKVSIPVGMYKSMVRQLVETHRGDDIRIEIRQTISEYAVIVNPTTSTTSTSRSKRIGAYMVRDDKLVNQCDLSRLSYWGEMAISRCFTNNIHTIFGLFRTAAEQANPKSFILGLIRNARAGEELPNGKTVSPHHTKALETFLDLLTLGRNAPMFLAVTEESDMLSYDPLFTDHSFAIVKGSFKL